MQYTNDGKFRAEIVEAAAVVKILERIGRRMNPSEVFEQIAGNPNVEGPELDILHAAA